MDFVVDYLGLIVQHVRFFPDFVKDYRENPKRQDAYIRAKRVFDILDSLKVWEDESIIPKDALIREYIGGSIYEY